MVTLATLVMVSTLSLTLGAADTGWAGLWEIKSGTADPYTQTIILDIRLPRLILALLVGGVLASCGAVTQGLFRNPLADPSLIGISAGAAAGASMVLAGFGSAIGLQLGSGWAGLSMVSVGAFIGSVGVAAIIYGLARTPYGISVTTMLLAGIAVNFLAGSLTSILELLGDDGLLRRMSLWRMGGLSTANYDQVLFMSVVSVLLLTVLPWMTKALNALLLGDNEAKHLGCAVAKVKTGLFLLVALGVGLGVAMVGMIAFVGLVVPHMVRLCCGPDHRFVLPFSAAFGAVFLAFTDLLARTLFLPNELPVGLVTAMIGAPVFIVMLRHRQARQVI